jgi:hypothetical protein
MLSPLGSFYQFTNATSGGQLPGALMQVINNHFGKKFNTPNLQCCTHLSENEVGDYDRRTRSQNPPGNGFKNRP